MDHRLQMLIEWIHETAKQANGLLVPISGGSDGALCYYLCCRAYPNKTFAVHVGDNLRCKSWFESLGTVLYIPEPNGEGHKDTLRWAQFMSIALTKNYWLVGTRNHTEEVFGNFSLASRIATYLPIIGLWKSDVMELCASVGVPQEVMDSSRRADPNCGRTKELAEIPLELIDLFLKVKEIRFSRSQLSVLTEDQIQYLEHVYQSNQFKRYLPILGPSIATLYRAKLQ